jgi:hypothetical protein
MGKNFTWDASFPLCEKDSPVSLASAGPESNEKDASASLILYLLRFQIQ